MKILKTLLVLGVLCLLSNESDAQLAKGEVQAFISAHPTSSVSNVYVIRKVEYNASNNDFAKERVDFDAASAKLVAGENALRITDKTGLEVMVPYNAIKVLTHQPENDKYYSSISVLVQ